MPINNNKEMTAIVYFVDGWYIVEAHTCVVLEGPYSDHADTLERMKTRAYRLSQVWAP